MVLDVYIGFLDEHSSWDDIDNAPQMCSPYFPNGHQCFYLFMKTFPNSKKLDWGAWGVLLKPAQIMEFIDLCEKESDRSFQRIRDYVTTLDSNQEYVLVRGEDFSDLGGLVEYYSDTDSTEYVDKCEG